MATSCARLGISKVVRLADSSAFVTFDPYASCLECRLGYQRVNDPHPGGGGGLGISLNRARRRGADSEAGVNDQQHLSRTVNAGIQSAGGGSSHLLDDDDWYELTALSFRMFPSPSDMGGTRKASRFRELGVCDAFVSVATVPDLDQLLPECSNASPPAERAGLLHVLTPLDFRSSRLRPILREDSRR